jgi:hypothetical protein
MSRQSRGFWEDVLNEVKKRQSRGFWEDVLNEVKNGSPGHIEQRKAKLAQTIYFIIPIRFKFE